MKLTEEENDHEAKLMMAYLHYQEETKDQLSFANWMIKESLRNHKKSVLMAGDLGKAMFNPVITKEMAKSIFNAGCFWEQGTSDVSFDAIWEDLIKI